jgi:hypothetical protein
MKISTEWIATITIILVLLASYALYTLRVKIADEKKVQKPKKLPSTQADGSIQVPILEIYGSLKGLGGFSLQHNKKNPELILEPGALIYRIMRPRTAAYDQIKWAHATSHAFYSKVHIVFKDRQQSLIAYLENAESLQVVMDFLERRGVPVELKND